VPGHKLVGTDRPPQTDLGSSTEEDTAEQAKTPDRASAAMLFAESRHGSNWPVPFKPTLRITETLRNGYA